MCVCSDSSLLPETIDCSLLMELMTKPAQMHDVFWTLLQLARKLIRTSRVGTPCLSSARVAARPAVGSRAHASAMPRWCAGERGKDGK